MIDFDRALEDFWLARRGGPFPVQWKDSLDRETGYRICLALIDRHASEGDPQLGWKVGLTAKALRAQVGATSPTFAVLYSSGRWPNGATHPYAELTRPGWENELCLTMGRTLNGPRITEAEAEAAVATIAPALEIIEHRPPPGQGTPALSTADNGQQRAFVVGDETPYDPALHDLSRTSVDLYVDGAFQERALGVEVMESSPIASIVWLANQLASFNLALEAGSVVMTGSFTKQYRFDSPVDIEARFDPFGTVTAQFT
ncbi:MAG: fumarylacetoacetate hydrolase family protein [Defluviicoccus sp.]|nr:fumarylacetoacetate hydrolase family protein [Defluviicoccus sp.]